MMTMVINLRFQKIYNSVVNGKGSDSNTKGGDERDGFVIQIDYMWALQKYTCATVIRLLY